MEKTSSRSGLSCLRDVCQKKRENVGIFPKSGTPLPPFGNVMFLREKKLWFILHFRTLGTFIVGGSPMLKTVKNGSGIRVDPPLLCFFQNSHIFSFFLADVLYALVVANTNFHFLKPMLIPRQGDLFLYGTEALICPINRKGSWVGCLGWQRGQARTFFLSSFLRSLIFR